MRIYKFIARILLFSLLISLPSLLLTESAVAEDCSAPNIDKFFYDDYYKGSKWGLVNGKREITYSISPSYISGEKVSRPFTYNEAKLIARAIRAWDITLDNISFKQVSGEKADLVIGITPMSSIADYNFGYWKSEWDENLLRRDASISIREGNPFLKSDERFTHIILHEVGNVLGLGDVTPNSDFNSPLEDPWQEPYGSIPLEIINYKLIRSLYGESTCPSRFNRNLGSDSSRVIVSCKSFKGGDEDLFESFYNLPIHITQFFLGDNGSKYADDSSCRHNHSFSFLNFFVYGAIIVALVLA